MTHEDMSDQVGAYPVCRHCGSRRIMRDAWASWNFATGEWVLGSLFDDFFCEECETESPPEWKLDEDFRLKRIQRLNDALRRGSVDYGSVVITQGVQALGEEALPRISAKVAEFGDFSPENDPHGEHDFGAFDHDCEKLFWKIDYFDRALKMHSPDKANPSVTHRVLTIMLASEY